MGIAIERDCDRCGKRYMAKTKRSKFCSDSCRARFSQGSRDTRTSPPMAPVIAGAPELSVVSATRHELTRIARMDAPLGATALALAARIDSGLEPGSAVAAMSKELRACLEELRRTAPAAANPLDELRARRERNRQSA